jgi:hypothetical protein
MATGKGVRRKNLEGRFTGKSHFNLKPQGSSAV